MSKLLDTLNKNLKITDNQTIVKNDKVEKNILNINKEVNIIEKNKYLIRNEIPDPLQFFMTDENSKEIGKNKHYESSERIMLNQIVKPS